MGVGMEENRGEGLELPRELANAVSPNMRQGLIIVTDPKDAEDVVRVFTGLIIDKDPYKIVDWRREYVTVSDEEFREELKLLTMPLLIEQPFARAVNPETGGSFLVIMRRIIIINLALPTGIIIFGQPSITLVVNDGDRVYLGYKGIDINTGNRITVTVKSTITDHATIPFTPAVARYIFIGDVVEAVIDDGGQVRGLRH
jgi:hypothetical protein